MKLPRRTPYEHADALNQLHNLFYSDDAQAQSQGVSIAHVWLNRSSCPHAVESTSSLIQARLLESLSHPLLDRHQLDWTLRSSYSSALLRFVNSVADAFQTGLYAQSIFNIAQRIGLPAWFVELRHAATHEELPSLQVCRQACMSALQWLDAHFWWPNMATSSSVQPMTRGVSQDLSLSLRRSLLSYRKIAKQVARDESLRATQQPRIEKLFARIDGSIRAVGGSVFVDVGQNSTLEEAVDILFEPGYIVPLAKRKRPRPTADGSVPPLPSHLYNTWFPLLRHLDQSVLGFISTFLDGLLRRLTSRNASLAWSSYTRCIAAWLMAIFGEEPWHLEGPSSRQAMQGEDGMMEDEDEARDRSYLIKRCLLSPTPASLVVARHLNQGSQWGHVLELANLIATGDKSQRSEQTGREEELMSLIEEMERHSEQVDLEDDEANRQTVQRAIDDSINEQDWAAIPGWAVAQDWQPCPLGCLRGAVPDLQLPPVLSSH